MEYEILKSKWWYRLLKVIYIFTLLIVLFIFNSVIVVANYKTINADKTKILCNYGDKKVFTAKDIELNLLDVHDFNNGVFDYKHFFEGYNDYEIKRILEKCYGIDMTNLDVYVVQRIYEITGTKDNPKNYTDEYLNSEIKKIQDAIYDKHKYLDYSVKLFDIEPSFTHLKFIELFIGGNLAILLVFEIIKGIFIYVATGKWIAFKYKLKK
jgi:hypothetical protein